MRGIFHHDSVDLVSVGKHDRVTVLSIYEDGDLSKYSPDEVVRNLRLKVNAYVRGWKNGEIESLFVESKGTILEILFATIVPLPPWLAEECRHIAEYFQNDQISFNHLLIDPDVDSARD